MSQDWEWEDLLSDKEQAERKKKPKKRPPERRTGSAAAAVKQKRTDAGAKSRRQSNLVGENGQPKPKPKKAVQPADDGEPKPKKAVQPADDGEPKPKKAAEPAGDGQPSAGPQAAKKRKKRKGKKRKRKKSVFPWIYLVFVILLAAAGAFIVRGVHNTMTELHANTPEVFIRKAVGNLTDQDLAALFVSNPAYETPAEAAANIREYISGSDMNLRRVDHNLYDAYRGEQKLFTVHLNAERTVNKLGLINYDILTSAGIEPVENGELYHYEIIAPSTCEITVNGKPVGEPAEKKTVDGFADAADFVAIPATHRYVLDYLTKEPEIRVTDNGTEVPVTLADTIDLTQESESGHRFASTEEAGIDFDAMAFAKDWAMFMRDDLGGEAHGYYKLEPFLIEDTALQQKAYQWAGSVDITFTSNHTLLDPPFTDEQITEVIRYDENAASVDVSLKMHMVLDRGQERTDVIDTTLYLVKQGDTWKVVNIRDDSDSSSGDDA
ncbi:MAG: hypothetical protein II868_02965 [Butyrivibrio sp.]|nr:hypothetical protein [Butyrivibrio sp.]